MEKNTNTNPSVNQPSENDDDICCEIPLPVQVTDTDCASSGIQEMGIKEKVADKLTNNALLLDRISKFLDNESRAKKCWYHLAGVLNIPSTEWRKFNTRSGPTEELFNYVSEEKSHLTVRDLRLALSKMYRNDLLQKLQEYENDTTLVDLISGDPIFVNLFCTELDRESSTIGNWKQLVCYLEVRPDISRKFPLKGASSTVSLFKYVRTSEKLRDLTFADLISHLTEAVFSRAVFQVAQRVTSGSPVKTVVFSTRLKLSESANFNGILIKFKPLNQVA